MKLKSLLKHVGTTLLFAAISLSAIPPVTASAADSLRGESVYQIMVDRFYDGDSSNNATGEAFRYAENSQDDFRYMHGGDWQGIIDNISYNKLPRCKHSNVHWTFASCISVRKIRMKARQN